MVEEIIEGLGDNSMLRRGFRALEHARVSLKSGATGSGSGVGAPTGGDEADLPREYFFSERLAQSRMPALSSAILARTDLAAVVRSRRAQFSLYLAGLRQAGPLEHVMSSLPDSVCPWAFPAVLHERSRHDLRLRSLGVPVWTFGNILHRFAEAAGDSAVLRDARYLADNLVCFPVHQGLSPTDVSYFVLTTNRYCDSQGS
jgi:dTDP-4-amino-4,6-dideoxygalactose transaminase